MNVHNRTPVALAQVKEYLKDVDENKPIVAYCKAFSKHSSGDAAKIMSALRDLNNPKMREELIVKILDLVPQDAEDLNKIFLEVSLTEEEANAILALVKK
ncbi:MAG TPA: hypothetical protein VJK03_03200 [Candidatus Nanoarchaeia archaeon]|nr:hypothetical protein [Candidatus Nanoarchaeia archaeon]